MKISVSILKEKNNYKQAVQKVNNCSADFLHLDIMDKTFTFDKSFNENESIDINNLSNKKLDIHIMSSNLDFILDKFIALKPEFISIHSEIGNVEKYLDKIKQNNIKVGLALNPETNIDVLKKYINKIDLVLVMSVNPGKSGSKFNQNIIPKLEEIKKIQKNYSYLIEVDGGINNETIQYVNSYADIVVSGSYITNSIDYEDSISILKSIEQKN